MDIFNKSPIRKEQESERKSLLLLLKNRDKKTNKRSKKFLKKIFFVRVTFEIYRGTRSVKKILANKIQWRVPLRHVTPATKNKTLCNNLYYSQPPL